MEEIIMNWTKNEMLEDERVIDLISAGIIGSSDNKQTIVDAVALYNHFKRWENNGTS